MQVTGGYRLQVFRSAVGVDAGHGGVAAASRKVFLVEAECPGLGVGGDYQVILFGTWTFTRGNPRSTGPCGFRGPGAFRIPVATVSAVVVDNARTHTTHLHSNASPDTSVLAPNARHSITLVDENRNLVQRNPRPSLLNTLAHLPSHPIRHIPPRRLRVHLPLRLQSTPPPLAQNPLHTLRRL